MKCIVTAGPTYETMDNVRRLTNFSTGRLGTELANFLAARGHEVTLLLGAQATHRGERKAQRVEPFSTTANLLEKLKARSQPDIGAVFHAAAVSDFRFGKIWLRSPATEIRKQFGKPSLQRGAWLHYESERELLNDPRAKDWGADKLYEYGELSVRIRAGKVIELWATVLVSD